MNLDSIRHLWPVVQSSPWAATGETYESLAIDEFVRFRRAQGDTLEAIGKRLNLSRERVRQREWPNRLKKRFGTNEQPSLNKLLFYATEITKP